MDLKRLGNLINVKFSWLNLSVNSEDAKKMYTADIKPSMSRKDCVCPLYHTWSDRFAYYLVNHRSSFSLL